MITEHNFEKLYLLKMLGPKIRYIGQKGWTDQEENALVFVHPKDAQRYRSNHHLTGSVVEIRLPYRLEYDIGEVWQMQRYYRTKDFALDGFRDCMIRARQSRLADHLWRVIDLITGDVVVEGQPGELVEIP